VHVGAKLEHSSLEIRALLTNPIELLALGADLVLRVRRAERADRDEQEHAQR
jgi:hypothetical protein